MTAAATLAFPGSRHLAEWWNSFASYSPRALWTAHLFVHRVDVLIGASHTAKLDPLHLAILRQTVEHSPCTVESLDDRLRMGRQILHQILRQLQSLEMVRADDKGEWTATVRDKLILERGEYQRVEPERRVFAFVETGFTEAPFHYLNVEDGPAYPVTDESLPFDIRYVEECVRQPDDWKRRHAFPLEAKEVIHDRKSGDPHPAIPPWKRVPIDRRTRMPLALVLGADKNGSETLFGFALQQEKWTMPSTTPVFSVAEGWREAFPVLTAELAGDAWAAAFRDWRKGNGVALEESDIIGIEKIETRLLVRVRESAYGTLREKLASIAGKDWLLAGQGRLRQAARLEIALANE